MKVAVLFGGTSGEREVSLASGAQVKSAFQERGHTVVAVDTGVGEITRLIRGPEMEGVEVIFLALHGGTGEDGTLQALLDLTGIPYVGSGRLGCTLAMDKEVTKRLLRDAGIATPEWVMAPEPALRTGSGWLDPIEERLGLPMIVKPPSGGSTLGLTLAHDRAELAAAVPKAARYEERILFERYIRGRELTVGIVGDEPLPVGEIIPRHEIFDYDCKYEPGLAEEIFPAELPAEVAARLQRTALEVHRTLFLRDFSRVDFILDADGEAWCLEANALPGLTANSLLPKAAQAAGISFPELCERIAGIALARS